MIKNHISYSQVEDEDFRQFLTGYLLGAVSIKTLLFCSRNTIWSWILDEYCRWKTYICKKILSTVSSMIHLSFDLWTATNNSAYINIIAHFLDAKIELCTVVVAVWNIHEDYSGKNQAKAIIPVIDKYSLKKKLGYFIINNASSNNICVAKIIDLIWPDLDLGERKLWCMGYIINLIAKVFIFDNKSETFKADIAIAKNTNNFKAAMKLWKKQNAIGKLHNLIWFIWALPQREAMFMDIAKSVSSELNESDNGKYHLTIIDNNWIRWNLTYFAIQRVFHLQYWVKKFYSTRFNKDKNFLSSNILNDNNWMNLLFFRTVYSHSIDYLYNCREIAKREYMVLLGTFWSILILSRSTLKKQKSIMYGINTWDF